MSFIDVFKWWLILIMAGVVFYVVAPKYYFEPGVRSNKVTGLVEYRSSGSKSGWKVYGDATPLKHRLTLGLFRNKK